MKKISWYVPVIIIELLMLVILFIIDTRRNQPNLFMLNLSLDSLSYKGAKVYWEKENPIPYSRLEIIKIVIDSLDEDVKEELSLSHNPLKIYYVQEGNYTLACSGAERSLACYNGIAVFLSKDLVKDNDDGFFAMIVLHEYVHVVQHNNKEYMLQYSEDVGWVEGSKPSTDPDFYMVLSEYSLTIPEEDMAETIMYSYLCGNSLEALSEIRMAYVLDFWNKPLSETCKNFD